MWGGGGVAIVMGWVVVVVEGIGVGRRVEVYRRRLPLFLPLVGSFLFLSLVARVGGWGWRGDGSRMGMSSVGIGRMCVMWEAGVRVRVSHLKG